MNGERSVEKTRDNDTRERDCIKPVVSCFIYGKNLHFHCFLLFGDNNNSNNNDWSWSRGKNATSRMNCLFYGTDELSFTIISALAYSFLLCINICKNVFVCITGVSEASKFFSPMIRIIRKLKSGMLFNSLFSCSQSYRLDVSNAGARHKTPCCTYGLWTIIFLLLHWNGITRSMRQT